MREENGSVLWGSFWMLLLSILLFWLPGIGTLLAGIVGGKVSGSAGRGFMAAILPSVILGVALGLAAGLLTGLPVVGFIAGMGGLMFGLINAGVLIVGALVGGLMA